ncbi:ABC transporter ATP-binding protein [Amycolatopsis regifaucium]|uniref:ABC transporter ATP-binding protein n=1 Tax=Amycolatopsis regifaucium TaxID=546365 RepID=A0A154MWP8_9PSEU|nr:ABC transporter ATP-binding protein [Amycolatopsis regifaucium]KZB88430.1 ABC transporter ATP-binding protein [Amycolatopsis regifaucium]OKA11504.1 ABC transporter ATP-binding protein [Amycolatopsis regifaucium]SFH45341.1 branched-chain amino acid transport system ATP-binding protein [Amycolatopsis regifaucium]
MLTVEQLSANYGPVRALDSVSLSVAPGEITAVLGANGAGKTTLLRTISGLVRPSGGRVTLAGRDLTGVSTEDLPGLGLAHVPEGRGVLAELTVEENLRLGALGARGRASTTELRRVYDLFPVLADRKNGLAHVLSGGERQMLVIGRALLSRPKVLLLDEPSLGLAPRIVAQIFELLRGLVLDGLAVVLVEQNARSALSIADHGVVLNLGQVVVRRDAAALVSDDGLRHAYLGF